MSDNNVLLNKNTAAFVPDEHKAAESGIVPGMVLETDSSLDVKKNATEPAVDADHQVLPLIADINEFDPNDEKSDSYADNDTVKTAWVPVGGKFDALLASGTDLSASAEANVTAGTDVLTAYTDGSLKAYTGADTTGDGTGSTTETVYDPGALFLAEESVDNSGASAGDHARIEVRRIA